MKTQQVIPATQGVVFLLVCAVTCTVLRLLVIRHDAIVPWSLGIAFLLAGTSVTWLALRKWRELYPVRCAAALGLSSAVVGSGLWVCVIYSLAAFSPLYWGSAGGL